MKKLLIIGGVALVLALVAVVGTSFFLGGIVTAGINKFGPKITQTSVQLDSARISPLTGSGTLTGLVVGNPSGWSDAPLASLGRVHVSLAPFSILGDHIVINEISIEAPEFNYETKLVASNVGDLMKRLSELTDGSQPAVVKTESGKPIKFEVKKFKLQNGWVRLGVGPAALKLPMPPVELTDIGTAEGGITASQTVFAVMRSVTPNIIAATTQAAGKIGGTAGAAAAESAKQAVEGIKGLFGGKKK